ncbi:MAG: HAD family hydrolase [Planctomycetota bacterium]|jgi:HAD superfamily hydrolase (TIGR01484 family)
MKKPAPFSDIPRETLGKVRVIASDVDDTLTRGGEIPSTVFAAIEKLRDAGIDTLLVTGRSYGWGLAEKLYFPVAGVIAENGGVWIRDPRKMSEIYFHEGKSLEDFLEIRKRMRKCFLEIVAAFPGTVESPGNVTHITDFVFPTRPGVDYGATYGIAEKYGFDMFISSVAGHITIPGISKGTMLEHALREQYQVDSFPTDKVLTIGDSTNDAGLFDRALFKLTVGVANIKDYLPALGENAPTYITKKPAADGFLEVSGSLISVR